MIDLHTHSTASDGSDSPTGLIELAGRQGLSAVALTDHDTVEGLGDARVAAEAVGVRLVPGCELSCEVGSATMHLLVYFLDDGPGPLQNELAGLQEARADRNRRIVDVLQSHGVDVTLEEILEEAGGGSVGRPHVAGVLLRKGYVSSVQEAFDVWLANGRPAYLDRERLLPAEAIRLAHASGAVTVLAHPTSLGYDEAQLERFVAGLAADGLDGLECEYGRYPVELRARLRALAERLGLAVTGGTDYHGRYKPDLSLGTGLGDLDVPDELLDALEARRPTPASPPT
ncbi:MAG TPA: PHP domain-containing protein [Acidimicrobiia bacterium]|nr:PHP domain-containing protein [Acidimicrobiia bacterium]